MSASFADWQTMEDLTLKHRSDLEFHLRTGFSLSVLILNILLIILEISIFSGVDLSVRYFAAIYALGTLIFTPFVFAMTPSHLPKLRVALLISWGVIGHLVAYALFVISLT